ncbi:Hypothetical_protein [Hexamita inflata]|uniref:Hypothetical_protein n=1 Tax=Hexamita inflata TaxID=28002 RepID=A0AA86NVU9_9EUKA|nr:Hypothetical protein HINF_LOCUS14578 [Hexamita inflata]
MIEDNIVNELKELKLSIYYIIYGYEAAIHNFNTAQKMFPDAQLNAYQVGKPKGTIKHCKNTYTILYLLAKTLVQQITDLIKTLKQLIFVDRVEWKLYTSSSFNMIIQLSISIYHSIKRLDPKIKQFFHLYLSNYFTFQVFMIPCILSKSLKI